ncbi:alpha/beta hydrolase [Chitinimonas sp. JJ19]|uniref:alpha/beta hydrolase n=1 Tax=Chitinimonas sp. JJ19 TaxID=3109352 RepID=UPI003001B830
MHTASLSFNSTNVRNLIALGSLRTGLNTLSRLAPRLAMAWAERLFLSPPRHAWPAAEQGWLALAEQGELHTVGLPVAEWDGKPMRTYRWGEARRGKIALMHGWGGRATQLHAFIAPLTAAGYQVVAIDAPGHGASPGKQASVLHFAHALERLVRNEGGVDGLIAHSLGGAASVFALSSQHLPVGRVALVSPSADVAAYARHVGRLLKLDNDILAGLQHRMETRLGMRWQDLNAVSLASTLVQPALVVHDQGDREVPSSTGSALASAWPGARLTLTNGLGHRRILRDQAVVDQVVAFLAH